MSKLVNQNSTLNRVPKTLTTRKVRTARGTQSVKVAEPLYQALKHHKHLSSYYTQTFRSVPSNLFANQGSKYSANLEKGAFTKLRSATLKITVTVNGANSKLAPVPFWFDRLEFRSGSKHLGIVYADNLMFNLGNLSGEQLKNVLRNANLNEDWTPSGRVWLTETAGRQVTVYLPLINTFINNSELYMKSLENDITIDFYPSSDIKISGSGTITCDDLQLICETETLEPEDEKSHDMYHSSVIHSSRYLDVVPVNFYNTTLTAGVQKKFELDSVHGKVAGMLLLIKNTGVSNTDNGNFNYVSLGDGSTVDILDPGSRSILGNGTPIDTTFLRNEVWPSHYNNDFNQQKHFYWIPFGANSRGSFAGQVDGRLELQGDRNFLAVTPASAGVQPVHQITSTEVATSGKFQLSFRGEFTNPMDYNASEATIKSNLELLRTIKFANPKPLSVSVSGTFDAGTTVNITFDQTIDLNGDKICFHPLGISGSAPVSGITQITSEGVNGFATGTYDVSLYAYVQNKVYQSTDGRLSIETE